MYSLGSTLFCLLTGKPPYEGDDVGEILRKVQRGEFAPPRRLDPSIDKALEAICKKAMALKPEDRYSSCRALAEDIERWMADEPVSAWAEPWTRKMLRWLTRHRTGVTGAAAALLAGVVGLSAVLAVQARANAALADKNTALVAANAKIAARYNLAVDAIETFHTGVSKDFLLREEKFKELRDRLLNSAAGFYEKLGALLKDETDLPSRRALLKANYEVACLAYQVGRKEDALALHLRVLAGREALAKLPGADPATAVDVARSLVAVGAALEATGKTEEALAAYERARSVVATSGGSPPEDAAARSAFADAGYRAGDLLRTIGRTSEARRAMEQARDLEAALAAADPKDNDRQTALANSHVNLGILLFTTGKLAEAESEYRKALAILQKLADDKPAVTEFRSRLASSHYNLGELLRQTGKPAEAEAEFRKALADPAEAGRRQPRRHRIPQIPGEQSQQPQRFAVGARASRRRRRPSAARRSRSRRSWPTTTPPSPNSASPWRAATTTSATCCRARTRRRRRRPSSARRWRSSRSWPTTTPPSPNSATSLLTATTASAS